MIASTILPLASIPGEAAATTTLAGMNALPNRRGNAVVPNGLGGFSTPSKAPPPPASGSTMRQLQVLGAASPVTQEEGVTWFG